MPRITVAVSPFYGGEEWTDEFTGITFKKDNHHQMAVYSIPENKNLSGIAKALLLNALILVDGDLGTTERQPEPMPEPVKPEPIPEPVKPETEPEEPATEPEGPVVEEPEANPMETQAKKPEARKKTTKK